MRSVQGPEIKTGWQRVHTTIIEATMKNKKITEIKKWNLKLIIIWLTCFHWRAVTRDLQRSLVADHWPTSSERRRRRHCRPRRGVESLTWMESCQAPQGMRRTSRSSCGSRSSAQTSENNNYYYYYRILLLQDTTTGYYYNMILLLLHDTTTTGYYYYMILLLLHDTTTTTTTTGYYDSSPQLWWLQVKTYIEAAKTYLRLTCSTHF